MCRRGSAEGNDNDNIMGIVKNYDIRHDKYTILIMIGADRMCDFGGWGRRKSAMIMTHSADTMANQWRRGDKLYYYLLFIMNTSK